jgi:uncharacterized protein (TIGR02246 family)
MIFIAIIIAFPIINSGVVFCQSSIDDEKAIRAINAAYVKAWLENSEEKVMALFEEGSSITPSGVGYFKGKDKIRSFWFPKDSSTTVIEKFTNEIITIRHEKDVIVTMSNSKLTWNYSKGTMYMAREQEGYALTFFRRQSDRSWRIWKQVWSDLWAKER